MAVRSCRQRRASGHQPPKGELNEPYQVHTSSEESNECATHAEDDVALPRNRTLANGTRFARAMCGKDGAEGARWMPRRWGPTKDAGSRRNAAGSWQPSGAADIRMG